jgi:hypothetical protein
MVQDFPAPTLLPQVLVCEKYVDPVILTLVMLSAVLPVLVSVVVCGGGGQVERGKSRQPNARLVGMSCTTVPMPLRLTFCRPPGALSVIDNVPVRVIWAELRWAVPEVYRGRLKLREISS